MNLTKGFTYDEIVEAKRYMNRGADYSLIYLWYNLRKRHYMEGQAGLSIAENDVRYYMKRNPEFKEDISRWFEEFKKSK